MNEENIHSRSQSFHFFPSLSESKAKYNRLVQEEMETVEMIRKEENICLPSDINYFDAYFSFKKEVAEQLDKYKPRTVSGRNKIGSWSEPSITLLL